jgi:hypothetical protein
VRAWARANCPDVLLGIYSIDELQGEDAPKDITPTNTKKTGVKEKLAHAKASQTRGFSEATVEAALVVDVPPAEAVTTTEPAKVEA